MTDLTWVKPRAPDPSPPTYIGMPTQDPAPHPGILPPYRRNSMQLLYIPIHPNATQHTRAHDTQTHNTQKQQQLDFDFNREQTSGYSEEGRYVWMTDLDRGGKKKKSGLGESPNPEESISTTNIEYRHAG